MSIKGYKMKRIIIIFIIVICLLSFMEISYFAEKLFNYGETWNSMSENEKGVYLIATQSALFESITAFGDYIVSYFKDKDKGLSVYYEEITTEREFDFYLERIEIFPDISNYCIKYLESLGFKFDFSLGAIIKVITDLYKDPANTYISVASMYLLAGRKLKGEDIEPLLQEARKKALP